MSYSPDYVSDYPVSVADAPAAARAAFVRRVYGHLAGAVLAFAALEAVLLAVVPPQMIAAMFSSTMSMILIFGVFIVATTVARNWAHAETSIAKQYMGLGLCVAAYGIFFLPLLYYAKSFFPGAIELAAILTGAVFGGLTIAVFVTRRDYSYMAPALSIGGMLAFGFIIASWFFDFGSTTHLIFAFLMVALMSAYIIYQTSVIMLHYRTDQHVGAALGLFATVATLFLYILQIVMSSRE